MEAARKDSEAGKVYPATSAPLLAASFLIDAHCGQLNDMYMACRQQQEAPFSDPRPCFPSGVMLEVCVDDLFGRIRNSCQETFERYWRCLDMNNQMFMYCREEEQALQACTRDRLVGSSSFDDVLVGAGKAAVEGQLSK